MSHYFVNDPTLKSEIQIIKYTFGKNTLSFKTDAGVFSKNRIDFGTNVLLNALVEDDIKDKRILDLGCGYGIIGLSIAKAYPNSHVDMVDVNERALELAKSNAEANNVNNVNIFESNLYDYIDSKYDVIISNPPIRAGKNIVHSIVVDGISHLNKGGALFVVIQKKQGAESLMKKIEEIFSKLNVVDKVKGYYVLKGIK